MLAAACVASTSLSFLPSPNNPNYRPAQAEPVLGEYLRLQCPAFRKAALPDSGVVRFAVLVAPDGQAVRADLLTTSGDQIVDEVFGTVAAQLTLAADSTTRRERTLPVHMHWACRGDTATVKLR